MKIQAYCKNVETRSEPMCFIFSSDFTSYTYVINTSSDTWHLSKRYSNFAELDDRLQQKFGNEMLKIPPLPPKKIVGALSPSLIKERRKGLELYLKAVLSNKVLSQSEEVTSWLEMPQDAAISDEEEDNWSRSTDDN